MCSSIVWVSTLGYKWQKYIQTNSYNRKVQDRANLQAWLNPHIQTTPAGLGLCPFILSWALLYWWQRAQTRLKILWVWNPKWKEKLLLCCFCWSPRIASDWPSLGHVPNSEPIAGILNVQAQPWIKGCDIYSTPTSENGSRELGGRVGSPEKIRCCYPKD